MVEQWHIHPLHVAGLNLSPPNCFPFSPQISVEIWVEAVNLSQGLKKDAQWQKEGKTGKKNKQRDKIFKLLLQNDKLFYWQNELYMYINYIRKV